MLEGKVAIITGCNRGIGASILELFSKNGAIIYAIARTPDSLDSKAAELSEKYNTKIYPVYFDITNTAEIKRLIMRISKEQKRLDCVVNNAGITQDALIGMISEQSITNTFEVNVFSVIQMIQYATKLMKRQKSGSIINLSSVVARKGNIGQLVYSASKGAVISLTKTAAKELAEKNIRVNAIAPGMIDTDMLNVLGEDVVTERIEAIPMKRLGTPLDVAKLALFLASDLSEYITGEVIGVDGAVVI